MIVATKVSTIIEILFVDDQLLVLYDGEKNHRNYDFDSFCRWCIDTYDLDRGTPYIDEDGMYEFPLSLEETINEYFSDEELKTIAKEYLTR